MEKKKHGGKRSEIKSFTRTKIFSANALQISEDDASRLVGGIVEKGITDTQLNKLFDSVDPPKPSVLPFPVARHRSHGPHWVSLTSKKGGSSSENDQGEDRDEDEIMMESDSVVNFAKPVLKKKKNELDFGSWREVFEGNNRAASNNEEHKVLDLTKSEDLICAGGADDTRYDTVNIEHHLSEFPNNLPEMRMGDSSTDFSRLMNGMEIERGDFLHPQESSQDVDDGSRCTSERVRINEVKMPLNASLLPNMATKLHRSALGMVPCSGSKIFKGEDASTSLESQIDAENRARIHGMSPDEISEAQAELMEKMTPALLRALKSRGQEKLKKRSSTPDLVNNCESGDLNKKNTSCTDGSPSFEQDISSLETTETTLKETKSGLQNVAVEKIDSGSSKWNTWNERVEAVRLLRFSLEGNIVENCCFQQEENGNFTVHGYNIDNVTSRDFLRTEGDPSAAGYTIKEAMALTRSVIPGQRVLGLHVISSVLNKALLNIHQKQVGSIMVRDSSSIDHIAIWAFALGPEPELALSLRMCLDDNHNSVVLACTEVIQCVLGCGLNETFFDTLERTSTHEKDLYTAPVFRSKPQIDVGFLQGGFWKYSAKPSNILTISDEAENDEAGNKYTIQDDVVVAGQDILAGLVRMGILPRLRYLLEADPSVALEENILSILIAVARHSPTCAQAIMKCERLVELVILRFTMNNKIDIRPFKMKSVMLLKVLARSDRQTCIQFVKNGSFQTMICNLYQYTSSIDQWVKSGKEKCKLSSALMVEQLRLWKVCIQYGYCISYFSDMFPALCLWLSPPNFEKLMEKNLLSEFSSISTEVYHVLEALARKLPNFFSQKHLDSREPGLAGNGSEIWSWSCVVPMVDLAVKWIESRSDPFISKFFGSQKGTGGSSMFDGNSLAPLLWIYSAVMKMLSQVFERIIPQDNMPLEVPWLPEFLPRVGLEIIKNGFLSFSSPYNVTPEIHCSGGSSFVEDLCLLREHGEFETSLASVCCLHGLMQSIVNIDRLIRLAKTKSHSYPPNDDIILGFSKILTDGMFKVSLTEQRSVLDFFTKVIALECDSLELIETFGRGGPAPGVGKGWGVSGGGYWSSAVLLAQNDATFLISLIEAFQIFLTTNILTTQESLTTESLNSVLAASLILGPRDIGLIEKILDFLVQAPILQNFNFYIHSFLQLNGKLKHLDWEYGEDDCLILSKILNSHYKDRWLSPKHSKSINNKSNFVDKTFKSGSASLDTIYEELDETDMISHDCTCLVQQWAYQRLPLPRHWVFSTISTVGQTKDVHAHNSSDPQKVMHDYSDLLEVAKGGLFFILGIEAFSTFLPSGFPSPVQSVPLIWKLHSLSVVLHIAMGVLDDVKSRDIYEVLQDLYGQCLDKARASRLSEPVPEKKAKYLPPQLISKNNNEFLMFQSEIHDSYPTFIETLVEQFSAVSYGDILYGRQIVLYLHQCVEASTRLAAWNALSNARVLELLPPLAKCFPDAEGYLHPIEDNEAILEAYVKSWVSGALDRSASRGSVAYLLALHHLSSYIFLSFPVDNLLLRNKLLRTLLRDCSRKLQHKGMMSDLILYTEPEACIVDGQKDIFGSSWIEMGSLENRLEVLKEACEKNSSLLKFVEELGSTVSHKLSNKMPSLP